jgi:uncharacterized RDD family membrane protein YckC
MHAVEEQVMAPPALEFVRVRKPAYDFPAENLDYAPLWRRLAACLVDAAIVVCIVVPSAIVLIWLMEALHGDLGMKVRHARYLAGIGTVACWVIGDWLYHARLSSSDRHATVGKRLLGIRVLDASGASASFAQVSTRHFAKFLSTFLLGLGFFMAAFASRRQALHDIVSNTVVVR